MSLLSDHQQRYQDIRAAFDKALAEAQRMIDYNKKAHQEEVERTEARNGWLATLRRSLEPK